MNEFYVTGSEPWLPVAEEGVVAHAFAQGSAKSAVQVYQSLVDRTNRFVRVRGAADWESWGHVAAHGLEDHEIVEEFVSGSTTVRQIVIRNLAVANTLLSLKNDGGDESTLVLSLSKKTGSPTYSLYVDISLNRLADPNDPKYVTYLRGTSPMKPPKWMIQSKKDGGAYITHAQLDPETGIWELGQNFGVSPEGGVMERFYHNISTPAKGQVVRASTSANDTVSLSPIDSADPFGVVYDGIPDSNGRIWIVTGGKAEVLYVNAVTRRQFARVCVAADTGAAAGSAIGEAMPTPPFSTDKHFQEVGHVLQTIAAPGLALTALHFN